VNDGSGYDLGPLFSGMCDLSTENLDRYVTNIEQSECERLIDLSAESVSTPCFSYEAILGGIQTLAENGFSISDGEAVLALHTDALDELTYNATPAFSEDLSGPARSIAGIDIKTTETLPEDTALLIHDESIGKPLESKLSRILVKYPEGIVTIMKETEDHVSQLDPDEILKSNAEMYKQKNEDYGESWRLAGETMAMWAQEGIIDEIDPTDETQMISVGLYFQRLHKLTRSLNLEFGSGDPNNEPIAESHEDESTYAAMHASLAIEDEDDR